MPGFATNRSPFALTAAATLAGLTAFAGCSADRGVYKSTDFRPIRVEVVDTLNDEALWAMDVPAGHKIVVDLDRRTGLGKEWDASEAPSQPAKQLEWMLHPIKARQLFIPGYFLGQPIERGEMDLPGVPLMVNIQPRPRDNAVPTAEPAPGLTPEPVGGSEPRPSSEHTGGSAAAGDSWTPPQVFAPESQQQTVAVSP